MKGRRHITDIQTHGNQIHVKNIYCEINEDYMKPKQATEQTEVVLGLTKNITEGVCANKT